MSNLQIHLQQEINLIQAGAGQLTNYLAINENLTRKLSENLSNDELVTITNALTGAKLRDLSANNFHNDTLDIMGEIKMLTGAILFDGEKLQVQITVIKRFLFLHFSMLNKKEIVNAFYLNAAGLYSQVYRHYNRELNCEFIGDVLREYLRYKINLRETKGHLIDKAIRQDQKQLPAPEFDLETWKEIIQSEYEAIKQGEEISFHVWSVAKYKAIHEAGLIPKDDKSTMLYFFKRVIPGYMQLTTLPTGASIKYLKFETAEDVYKILKGDIAKSVIISEAKRMCYYYVLNSLTICGINNIFQDVQPF